MEKGKGLQLLPVSCYMTLRTFLLDVYSFPDTSFPFGITVVVSLVATTELGTSA